jgi:hypothetical protein
MTPRRIVPIAVSPSGTADLTRRCPKCGRCALTVEIYMDGSTKHECRFLICGYVAFWKPSFFVRFDPEPPYRHRRN